MKLRRLLFLLALSVGTFVSAAPHCRARQDVPCETAVDYFLEGYIQYLIDTYYTQCGIQVVVKNRYVYLADVPNNCYLVEHLLGDIRRTPGIKGVSIVRRVPHESKGVVNFKKRTHSWQICEGQWLPQTDVLWQTLIADPRQVMYSAAYRMGDRAISDSVAAVSFGDTFPIYRWCRVFKWEGELQIDVEGGVWAVFDLQSPSNGLINADYYMGIPLTYASGPWSFRLRLYHISSHLGDEYIVAHPGIVRVNPSVEALDLFASYQVTPQIRLYGGVGDYFISDPSFRQNPLYVAYGFEIKIPWYYDFCRQLIWTPFIAVYIENKEMDSWIFDQNYSVGMEVGPMYGINRQVRLSLEWHDGLSEEGQLSKLRTSYGQIKFAYGF